ncbi:MAG TPA: urease accessory protein UreF, partial [Alphaproteobacteria bacterium]|nr:urease accessory protein UreF [Alphaproteobacteria bacterium]
MTDSGSLQRLLTWLSPAFPVGAFAWSAGLETAIAEGRVRDADALRNWIEGALQHGGIRTDAIVLAHAWRAQDDAAALGELAALCLALTPAAERLREAVLIGDAFVAAAAAWPSEILDRLPRSCPYPIAVGAIAAAHRVALDETLLGYLVAAAHAQVSVAIRLVPLGQTDGLRVMAALERPIDALARAAASARLDEIGGIAYAAEIAQ